MIYCVKVWGIEGVIRKRERITELYFKEIMDVHKISARNIVESKYA
jgi:hypothetical protein